MMIQLINMFALRMTCAFLSQSSLRLRACQKASKKRAGMMTVQNNLFISV